jgi:four helix bundle protein
MLNFKARILDIFTQLTNGYEPDPEFQLNDLFQEEGDKGNGMVVNEPPGNYGDNQRKGKEEFVVWLKNRTKTAAIQIVNLMERTGNSPGLNVVRYQLIKPATSSAANYRAACRARSGKEFYAKMCIVVEETDESLFWLEILEESEIGVDKYLVKEFQKEWLEILKIMAKAKQNAYRSVNRQ